MQRRKKEREEAASRARAEAQSKEDARTEAVGEGGGLGMDAADAVPTMGGMLSTVFDEHMTPYITLEKRNMEEMMRKVIAEEQVDRDGSYVAALLPLLQLPLHTAAAAAAPLLLYYYYCFSAATVTPTNDQRPPPPPLSGCRSSPARPTCSCT